MRIRPVGADALLIDVADDERVADLVERVEAWRTELWRRRDAGALTAREIVPGAASVLLDGLVDRDRVAAALGEWTPGPVTGTDGPLVEVPTVFDGEDLGDVAAHWGVSPDEAVARMVDAELRVAFCGFAPGFAYLTGLRGGVPRLAAPRPRVPAGAVALAGDHVGIYPAASPGGWRLVGRTDLPLFDVHRDPPALLVPGTRVRLLPRDGAA
jgi:KipI family sensor histidine kinase inhibitor